MNMAKKGGKIKRCYFQAKLVSTVDKCVFCRRAVDDEVIYGKLYAIGDIQCHYFCVLLSCCLVQKGRDDEGLFGFLYPDIVAEVERSKKHRCSYCGRVGAAIGCSVLQCRKQFHLPCGREKNAVSMFCGNYKSFCANHAPRQKIAEDIMVNAKRRIQADKRKKMKGPKSDVQKICAEDTQAVAEAVCGICYETVDGYPTLETFWPPCCARDAWFHRSCLQRMALSAGMHYLKCPLCNDKERFYKAVVSQGYYVPDRDAAWELEQDAFSEIYERDVACAAASCRCPHSRSHDCDTGPWDIKLCILCGSSGIHAGCRDTDVSESKIYLCAVCEPAAPADLERLLVSIETVERQERPARPQAARRGPVMPSRMSLRRTKRAHSGASSSSSKDMSQNQHGTVNSEAPTTNLESSRLELNLKTPRKRTLLPGLKQLDSILTSPIKMLEQSLMERVSQVDLELDSGNVLERLREKFKKPRPLVEKKRIVNKFLEELLNNKLKDTKSKEPVKEWNSPKKLRDCVMVVNKEYIENSAINENINSADYTKPENEDVLEANTDDPAAEEKSPLVLDEDTQIPTEFKEHLDTMVVIEVKDDDSSSSSFILSPEFIGQDSSDADTPTVNTQKLTTVNIQKDSSMEISEHDQTVNIDLTKMEDTAMDGDFIKSLNIKSPVKNKKCALKFSPIDKETLQTNIINIDVEKFKSHYLNEVDREKSFKNKDNTEIKTEGNSKVNDFVEIKTEKNFEVKDLKRKLPMKHKKTKRRRKKGKSKDKDLGLTVDKEDKVVLKYKKKHRRKKNSSIQGKDLKVRIKWKEERLKLKITGKKKKKLKNSKLKQYVLKYTPETTCSQGVIAKPECDVTPVKRKCVKAKKLIDNMVQTSISNFFKATPK